MALAAIAMALQPWRPSLRIENAQTPMKRVDPADGKSYTLTEMQAFYQGKHDKKSIDNYWATCKVAKNVPDDAKTNMKGNGSHFGAAGEVSDPTDEGSADDKSQTSTEESDATVEGGAGFDVGRTPRPPPGLCSGNVDDLKMAAGKVSDATVEGSAGLDVDRTLQPPPGLSSEDADDVKKDGTCHNGSTGLAVGRTPRPPPGLDVGSTPRPPPGLCLENADDVPMDSPTADKENQWKLIDPLAVCFSRTRVAPSFTDWKPFDCDMDVMPCELADYDVILTPRFPPMTITRWCPKLLDEVGKPCTYDGVELLGESQWFTLDNRRLLLLQRAAAKFLQAGQRAAVVVHCVKHLRPQDWRKFDTSRQGRCAKIWLDNETTAHTWDSGKISLASQTVALVDVPDGVPIVKGRCGHVRYAEPVSLSGGSGEEPVKMSKQQRDRENKKMRRNALNGPSGDPAKDALVEKIKNFKSSQSAWGAFCATQEGGNRDPSRYPVDVLQQFIQEHCSSEE